MKFLRKTKGAISIFLALIILPMYTCAGLIVDGARVSGAKTALSGAGDLVMNAALSEYDGILQDVYGLFAMSDSVDDLQKNVTRYFNNTINNTGVLEGSDSYTRSFINSIGSWFSTDEISFDNIVDTQVESFKLVEVSDSALANPVNMERQIVEYMKYRGPVSIGKSLLTKLGCIGETSKQTKVIEKKVDYEKQLDSVEDACETAYKAIEAFNAGLDTSPFKNSTFTSSMQTNLNNAKAYTKDMVKYQLAVKASNLSVNTLTLDTQLQNSIMTEIENAVSADSTNINYDRYKAIKEKISDNGLTITQQSDGSYEMDDASYLKWGKGVLALGNDLNKQISFVIKFKPDFDEYKAMVTYLEVYLTYYNNLDSSEKEQLKAEKQGYVDARAYIFSVASAAKECQEMEWKNSANDCAQKASKELYDNWYVHIDSLETDLQNAIDALNTVKNKISDLESLGTDWKNSIEDLSDSEIKTSMEGDYSSTAKNLNTQEIDNLKSILEKNKTQLTNIKNALESVKLNGVQICVSSSTADRFSGINSTEITASNIANKADDIMKGYSDANLSGISASELNKITESCGFYKYLKGTFAGTDNDSQEDKEAQKTAKENAKTAKKNLINKGNNDASTTADSSGIKTGSYDSVITSEISAAIDQLASSSADNESFSPTDVDKDESDKKIAEQNKKNLTKVTNLLSSLENVAENARDKIYLEEYFTEMFSCYTSGKDTDGNAVQAISLSGHDMSTDQFYRSEVEYILWGNDDVQTNLNNTKAMIFGIRFALNSVFAFTSSYTRTQALTAATAIAGWTGFGVPIVQTVILLAWSMAESVVDVNNLCNGEAVCIYKSASTWQLGIDGAIETGKKYVLTTIDSVMEKVESIAIDKINEVQDDVTKYVNDTTESIVESVKDTVLSTIESKAQEIFRDTNCNLTKEDIKDKVDEMFTQLQESASGSDVTSVAIRTAVQALDSNTIADKLFTLYQNAKNQAQSKISEELSTFLESLVTPIKTAITSTVSEVGESLKTEVSQIIANGGDAVKTSISNALDAYAAKIGGGSTGGGSLASGKTFSLTYKEYLKIFTLMFMMSDDMETAMLSRCAKLIQANVAAQESSFDISKAYTMVEVNATVSVRTTFFDIPVSTGVDANGNTVYELDYGNLGTGRQNIKYVGILSY